MRVDLQHSCYQLVNENDKTVVTHFADGSSLTAVPNYDDESVARAEALGYGWAADPVWQMTKEHDRLHMELAQAQGDPHSPTLHAVANRQDPDSDGGHREECLVFHVQRLLNEGL
jgi:hypothetical protein